MSDFVAEMSTFWFSLLCIVSSLLGIMFLPALIVLVFDIIGVNTEIPLLNSVGWSLVSSALLGLISPIGMLMIARKLLIMTKNEADIADSESACTTDGPSDMLRSAEAWLNLAKQSGRRIRNVGERPLVRAKFVAHRAG